MATFCSAVLGQPEIASMVFEFQFGIYDDVRHVFRACNELVEFDAGQHAYVCDASFRATLVADAVVASVEPPKYHFNLRPKDLSLRGDARDERLPLHLVIADGFVDVTRRILGCRPDLASDDAIRLAFSKDHVEIATLLLELRANRPVLSRRDAFKSPPDSSMRHALYYERSYWTRILAREDTTGLDFLKQFDPHSDDCREQDRQHAIQNATLENLTLALAYFSWLHYPSLLDDVAGRGFLPLVQSLHERGVDCSMDAMDKAASNGHLEVVRFLHSQRGEGCTTKAMEGAATNGHLEVVQFLHFNRTEGCTTKALDGAIAKGHLDVVRFLLEHRTEGASRHILDKAAANGHLEVVQYLHSLGSFACTVDAVDEAVSNGHLDVITFLLTHRSEGCSRDDVIATALEFCHLQVAEYLVSLGYPFPTTEIDWSEFFFHKTEMIGVLRLYLENGGSWDNDWMPYACAANHLQLVEFLHEQARACSRCRANALEAAIRKKASEVVSFLLDNCTAKVSLGALKQALRLGHLDTATRILQRQPELRFDELLQVASSTHNTEATRYLLAAGIGNPRECLIAIAGRRQHVSESKLLLPYCMDTTDHLDNVIFLLDLFALPDRHSATTRPLIAQELTYQGREANQTITLAPSVTARASTLLEAGDVFDWAIALAVGCLWTTNARVTVPQLEKYTALVQDTELKEQVTRLLPNTDTRQRFHVSD